VRGAWLWATLFMAVVCTGSVAISTTAHLLLGALSQLVSLPLTILWGGACTWVAFKLAWRKRGAP
jgi:hypothetical protein